MKLKDKTYDFWKYVALVGLPAITTFVGVVLQCFNVECTDIVITIMVAFDTLIGSLLGISNANYKKGK